MKKPKLYLLNCLTLICSMILVGLDQWFKALAVKFLYPIETKVIWEGVFQLTYIENRGAAFGIFSGKKFMLVGVTGAIIFILMILILLGKIKRCMLLWSLALIIGGGIGNLIDRIFLGYVVDYLHITLFQFPVFNFADCCVVIGTILLIIYFVFFESAREKELAK